LYFWPGGNICDIENHPLLLDPANGIGFEDEFNGTTLNNTLWQTFFPCRDRNDDQCLFSRTHLEGCSCDNSTTPPTLPTNCNVNEIQIYEDDNVVVNGDGTCSLRVLNESSSWFCQNSDYTSGVLHTVNPVNGFGRYEIMCQMPISGAYWPNFWTWGWGFEFDIAEYSSGSYNPTIHNFTHNPTATDKSKESFSYTGMRQYALEYDPYRIKFFVDDVLIDTIPRFLTIGGTRITDCQYLAPQMLKINKAFPRAGSPYDIIADVSLWSWLLNGTNQSLFEEEEMIIDYIRFLPRDIPCGGFNFSRAVADDMTYTGGRNFNSLMVRNGATLTLENGTYNFDFDGSIFLEEGASLVLNNATLTACDVDLGWSGIEAEESTVITLNASIIEEAQIGIDLRTNFRGPATNLMMTNTSGIRDCKTGIATNYGECNFTMEANTFIQNNEIGIHARKSTGLILSGVRFIENDEGIRVEDSFVQVREANSFVGDDIGISVEGTYPGNTGVNVGDASMMRNIFTSNRIGINSIGAEHVLGANIVNCEFVNATSAAAIFDGANEFNFTNNTIANCQAGCGALTTGANFNNFNCNALEDVYYWRRD